MSKVLAPSIASLQKYDSLTKLEAACLTDENLKTDLANTRLVFASGNENTLLMLIGEAPGAEEDKVGKPFIGRSGRLLISLIEEHLGLTREDVYIANIVKHRPPDNRDPKPAERQYALPYLVRQIQLVQPKIILCVGRISAQTLLNNKWPLKTMRGNFYPFEQTELTASYHPAALLRNPNWKPEFISDLALIKQKIT
jgi:DNA polymerase